ncbi:transmembrane protein 87A [Octopus bimaculoides]|uniref:Transmembrane protein 87A n=1 Tax=Octopus bimaculoides TaxID=37653 RepID=A0A0L8HEX0_OCTBM|nr:transmembrane protein 87A [Octopus bimaculoides]|eukprot:XP_014772890.1 PREDICTED: transmembrane protein 87A-like [Octopus bimaculoides]
MLTMNNFYSIYIFFFICVLHLTTCLPEQGIKVIKATQSNSKFTFVKTTYNQTKIYVKISCQPETAGSVSVSIRWALQYFPCANELALIGDNLSQSEYIYYSVHTGTGLSKIEMTSNKTLPLECKSPMFLPKWNTESYDVFDIARENVTKDILKPRRQKRSVKSPAANSTAATVAMREHEKHSFVASTWHDGPYAFFLEITSDKHFTADITIRMLGKHGYLSANEWPLLLFFGIMGLLYIFYGIVWLLLLACNWRDLLRIQFWIGAVILLGMLEKAVFYAEYQSISSTGVSVRGAVIFAELVSCFKRMLARMLVVIVSLGFGIVKPRLGLTFHKVLCVGILYFILASIESCLRALKSKSDQSKELMLANVPLAVVDAAICWWIFSGLVQTTRTLRLRRNIVKLSLYRHFTNTLIFAVLASISYMAWSISQHKLKFCLTDWRELWVDDAFWHLLFSVLLLVIMILWRPSANNQRYAFSPLLDAEDEDDDDTVMNDAFDGMKMRGAKPLSNGSPKQKDSKNKAEDDLKWVEDNIPTSVADKALPSLIDSDEEIMTTKFEISKME